jgi:alpha-glucosidase
VNPNDPHHDGSPLYCDTIAPDAGEVVQVRVRVPIDPAAEADPHARIDRVVLRTVRDGEPHVVPATVCRRDQYAVWWQAPLEVRNPLTTYRFALVDGAGALRWLNAEGIHDRDVTDAADFKLSTEHRLPDWVADQIGYQIFPDRFARTHAEGDAPAWAIPAEWDDPVIYRGPDVPFQWYGGTIDGITEHLDHLIELGATMLYLTPVFEAWSNHRYDAVSFDRVDPVLGGDAALERLIKIADDHDIRVMGDLTTNHTGDHHDWFRTAMADPDSPERAFYTIRDDGSYECWWDYPSLPKLDHHSAELARRLYAGPDSVVARWLEAGFAGWRIDVANMTGRMGADDLAHQVATRIRATLDEVRPDAWLLAEHGHDASLDLTGPGWHGTMDYTGFTRPTWCWLNGGGHDLPYLGMPVGIPTVPGAAAVATMREVHAAMPWAARCGSTLHLDSHDVPRFRTVAGGGTSGGIDTLGAGRDHHHAGLMLQMTMPGVPVVFMGDEIGLTGVDGEHARTPFPWSHADRWDAPTLAAYRTAIAMRREHIALRRGGLRWLHAGEDVIVYVREHPEETVLVQVARQATEPVRLPRAAFDAITEMTVLWGEAPDVGDDAVVIPTGTHVVRLTAGARLAEAGARPPLS